MRGDGPAGEPEIEIVHRLEQLVGAVIDVGPLVQDEQHVRQGVVARFGRHAAGHPQPADQPRQAVAADLDPSVGDASGVRGAARVGPMDGIHQVPSLAVDRHGHRPLAGAADGRHALDADQPAVHQFAHRVGGRLPPLVGILLAAAVWGQEGRNCTRGLGHQLAAIREQRHLRTARSQVDGQHVGGCLGRGHADGRKRPSGRRPVAHAGGSAARATPLIAGTAGRRKARADVSAIDNGPRRSTVETNQPLLKKGHADKERTRLLAHTVGRSRTHEVSIPSSAVLFGGSSMSPFASAGWSKPRGMDSVGFAGERRMRWVS